MLPRYRSIRQISSFLCHVSSGNHLHQSSEAISLSLSSSRSLLRSGDRKISNTKILQEVFHSQRYSTISQVSNESTPPEVNDLLSFIASTFDELQGPNHCWLNMVGENIDSFKKDGTFLVLAGKFLENSQMVAMLEKVKLLQQRFPRLRVMGFHSGSSIFSATDQTHMVELILEEYITFPILLCDKNFQQMEKEAWYILFRDIKNPVVYHGECLDHGMLSQAVKELHLHGNGNPDDGNARILNLKPTWLKQVEVIKEPNYCPSLQNLLLHYAGCVSSDESGDRLFLSDSNHHRIVICDGNGKLLDCIGSFPGFEDGEFDSAKLARPAASFYHDTEDCLYIVDSENHAIRRADLKKRVLETLYPSRSIGKKNNHIWTWIVDKLGFGRNTDAKSKQFDSLSLVFPWHLLKSADNCFLIISRSFETLWIMDLASGDIKESIKGFPKILEICGQLIMEKVSILKQIPNGWLQQQSHSKYSLKGLPYARLVSSLTTFQNHVIMCDTVSQRVMKLRRACGACSTFHFSNFGILGLPYWLSHSLERVHSNCGSHVGWPDHVQCFSLLPGRIDMQLNIDIPVGTELIEPLHGDSVWRQARGAATEVFGAMEVVGSSEKIGVAQQWYDELDNLTFLTQELEMTDENDDDCSTSGLKSQDGRVHIDCAVNTSPGTSEVIILAVLYLKLRRQHDLLEDSREKQAARIADILTSGRSGGMERESCLQFLLGSNLNLRDVIFIRPLHVSIKLDTLDHPKAINSKDIILTDSSIEVDVSLQP